MTALPSIGKVAVRSLGVNGITTLEQVSGYSEKQLLAIHGVGPKAIRTLAAELAARGLGFAGPAK